MNISKEAKKSEAIARMKALGVFPETIRQFEKEDLVSKSEPPFGAFYWVEDDELEELRTWEEEHNALVYLVVRSYTTFGTMDSYLFVSDYEEEWEYDRNDLPCGIVFAYTLNRTYPDFSEFGSIGVKKTIAAGLVRTA